MNEIKSIYEGSLVAKTVITWGLPFGTSQEHDVNEALEEAAEKALHGTDAVDEDDENDDQEREERLAKLAAEVTVLEAKVKAFDAKIAKADAETMAWRSRAQKMEGELALVRLDDAGGGLGTGLESVGRLIDNPAFTEPAHNPAATPDNCEPCTVLVKPKKRRAPKPKLSAEGKARCTACQVEANAKGVIIHAVGCSESPVEQSKITPSLPVEQGKVTQVAPGMTVVDVTPPPAPGSLAALKLAKARVGAPGLERCSCGKATLGPNDLIYEGHSRKGCRP